MSDKYNDKPINDASDFVNANETANKSDELNNPNNLSEDEIYIKIKDYASDIKAPEELSPEAIKEKLKTVSQRSTKKSFGWKQITAIAASFAVLVTAGALGFVLLRPAANNANDRGSVVADSDEGSSAISDEINGEKELTYEEIGNIINNYNETYSKNGRIGIRTFGNTGAIPEEEAVEDAAGTAPADENGSTSQNAAKSSEAGQSSNDYSETDRQVDSVAEGDIVKTDGKYIYTVESSMDGYKVHIIKPDGKNSREISVVRVDQADCREMHLYGNYLITMGEIWKGMDFVYAAGEAGDESYIEPEETEVHIFDISDPESPTEVKKLTASGSFATSRISENYLYIFTEKIYSRNHYDITLPKSFIPCVDGEMIPEERIKKAGDRDINNYMIMTSVSLSDPTKTVDSLALLGGFATYYMNQNNIYIARRLYDEDYDKSCIVRVSYKDGMFKKEAVKKIKGVIENSYYMHEYKGNFCFVYMRFGNLAGRGTSNGLCVMNSDLKVLGEIEDVAPGETIQSSYYIDNMAYFVTYKNTDPVFAVDLSDPSSPVIKSELKIPGFSSYLHSFGEGQLIGIGYGQDDGDQWDATTKLSLFDIGKDYDIKEISKVFGPKESQNIADQNHRAVFVDEERMLVGLGLDGWDDEKNESLTRYQIYKQKGDELKLVLDRKLSGISLESKGIYGVRGVRIGETFYICDCSGVLDVADLTEL